MCNCSGAGPPLPFRILICTGGGQEKEKETRTYKSSNKMMSDVGVLINLIKDS